MVRIKKERRPTPKQYEFAKAVVAGKTQREAYIHAYSPKP
jgi:hypothetical protein